MSLCHSRQHRSLACLHDLCANECHTRDAKPSHLLACRRQQCLGLLAPSWPQMPARPMRLPTTPWLLEMKPLVRCPRSAEAGVHACVPTHPGPRMAINVLAALAGGCSAEAGVHVHQGQRADAWGQAARDEAHVGIHAGGLITPHAAWHLQRWMPWGQGEVDRSQCPPQNGRRYVISAQSSARCLLQVLPCTSRP